MKRHSLLFFFTVIVVFVHAQSDYIIEIGSNRLEIELGKTYDYPLGNSSIPFVVKMKDTLMYDGGLYNFLYPKEFKVAKTNVQEGLEQIMLMTADGSGFLIQKYSTLNPSSVTEIMLKEITKESLNYGYEEKRKDYKRTLKSGQKIEITKSLLKYKDESNIYEVATIGGKDEGILIMTMIIHDHGVGSEGKDLINLMWNTLSYK